PLSYYAPAPSDPSTLSLHDALPISSTVTSGRSPERMGFPRTRVCPIQTGAAIRPYTTRTTRTWATPTPPTTRASTSTAARWTGRSEEHTSELQSRGHLVCRLLLEKK